MTQKPRTAQVISQVEVKLESPTIMGEDVKVNNSGPMNLAISLAAHTAAFDQQFSSSMPSVEILQSELNTMMVPWLNLKKDIKNLEGVCTSKVEAIAQVQERIRERASKRQRQEA